MKSDNPSQQQSGREPSAMPAPLKKVFALKREKERRLRSQFLLEGVKAIEEALRVSPGLIRQVHLVQDFNQQPFLRLLKQHEVSCAFWPKHQVDRLSDVETPQGAIAVAEFPRTQINWETARRLTILDQVQDPANVGAIFRTALALGMDGLLLGKGTCEPYNPKVVRSSVGSMLRLPFETGVEPAAKFEFLRQKGFSLIATSSHAQQSFIDVDLKEKVALVMGNEGRGADPRLLSLVDSVVGLPLLNQVESLNVAVAHGLLCYQLLSRTKSAGVYGSGTSA